jgi:hypothetical protein
MGRIDLTGYYGNRVLLDEAMGRFGDKILDPPQLDAETADPATYDPENVSDGRKRIIVAGRSAYAA